MNEIDLFSCDNEPQAEDPGTVGFLDFHGELIPVLSNDGGTWPSVTRLCQAMGIDPEGQRQAILRKHWAEGMTFKTKVMLPGQPRAYPNLFLHEKRVPMWLANIETDRLADPIVRARVEATQVEFADVLAEWVATGQVRPAQPPLPQNYGEALRALADQWEVGEQQAREIAQQKVVIAELDEDASGYKHFLETDGTFKFKVAAQNILGVGDNLLGEWLRANGVLKTDVYENKDGETRQGEQHNRPYSQYTHWFAFPAYSKSECKPNMPAWRRFDRRVTTAGLDGIRRKLKRHVHDCGECSLCKSLKRNKPAVFDDYRSGVSRINSPKDAA